MAPPGATSLPVASMPALVKSRRSRNLNSMGLSPTVPTLLVDATNQSQCCWGGPRASLVSVVARPRRVTVRSPPYALHTSSSRPSPSYTYLALRTVPFRLRRQINRRVQLFWKSWYVTIPWMSEELFCFFTWIVDLISLHYNIHCKSSPYCSLR